MNTTNLHMPLENVHKHHKLELIARRFLIPRTFVTLYGLCRWRATISTRAEVELSPNLTLRAGNHGQLVHQDQGHGWRAVHGQKCGFGPGCFIAAGAGGIHVGDHVIFGPNVSVIAANYCYGAARSAARGAGRHLAGHSHRQQRVDRRELGDPRWLGNRRQLDRRGQRASSIASFRRIPSFRGIPRKSFSSRARHDMEEPPMDTRTLALEIVTAVVQDMSGELAYPSAA